MSDPETDPTERPAEGPEAEAEKGATMARTWFQLAVVATVGTVLLVLGLMQATGLVALFSPFVESEVGQWIAYAILVAVVVAAGAWSWRIVR